MNKRPQPVIPASLNFAPTSDKLHQKIRRWAREFDMRGTSPEYDIRENARIRLLNRLYLGIIPLLGGVFLLNIFLYEKPIGALMVGLAIVFYVTSMVFTGRRQHGIARWSAVLPIILILDFLTIYFGRSSGGSISFLIIGLGTAILFTSRLSKIVLLGILLCSFAVTELYLFFYEPILLVKDGLELLPPLIFTSNFVVMVVVLLYFEELVSSSRKETARLLSDLQEKNKSLSQTNYELAHFAKTASYHFKAPLKNISSMLGLLERKIPESSPQSLRIYVDLVKGNSAHLYRLVEDILMYSNVDNLAEAEEGISTSISGVTEKIMLNIHSFLTDQHAEIILEEDFDVPMAASHLELLLQNLIQNGIKYNQSARKTVTIRQVSSESENMMSFEIQDNGVGISSEYHDSIFGMFSRLYSNDEYEGTGIGLAICQKIVFLYRGGIGIESEPGNGSRFRLTLPLNGNAEKVSISQSAPPNIA